MKKVGNFQTEDPKRLSEQLDRFQEAVDNETGAIRLGFIPQLEPKLFTGSTPISTTLLTGQIALCDSNLGNVVVVLSLPTVKAPPPGWLAIAKRAAANNVTVRPSGVTDLGLPRRVNAAASLVIAAVGLSWLYFDGADWWG